MLSLEGAIAQGIIWGIMAIGVYITYRVLDFSDLSVDGTLGFGAAVSAILITQGMDPYLSLLVATFAGALAGLATGIFNTVFKIPPILSGILTMIGLYSISIRVMKGSSNIALFQYKRVTTPLNELFVKLGVAENAVTNLSTLVIGVVFAAALIAILYYFLGTEFGTAIRSTGSNANMSRALGVNTDLMKVVALVISNALFGLSGALIGQTQGAADVQLGQGAIVIGLASIIIGEVIMCRKDHSFWYKLCAVIVGSIIYRIIYALTIAPLGQSLNLRAYDTKLITALIIAIALAIPVIRKALAERHLRKANDKKFTNVGGTKNA
ncbi:MAG: ABC transporter permease [Oscillospiraceae bacterium]|nr:ABC transporter permease [Oscillospiraceae bacterium]